MGAVADAVAEMGQVRTRRTAEFIVQHVGECWLAMRDAEADESAIQLGADYRMVLLALVVELLESGDAELR